MSCNLCLFSLVQFYRAFLPKRSRADAESKERSRSPEISVLLFIQVHLWHPPVIEESSKHSGVSFSPRLIVNNIVFLLSLEIIAVKDRRALYTVAPPFLFWAAGGARTRVSQMNFYDALLFYYPLSTTLLPTELLPPF